jgi:hypothetical protein
VFAPQAELGLVSVSTTGAINFETRQPHDSDSSRALSLAGLDDGSVAALIGTRLTGNASLARFNVAHADGGLANFGFTSLVMSSGHWLLYLASIAPGRLVGISDPMTVAYDSINGLTKNPDAGLPSYGGRASLDPTQPRLALTYLNAMGNELYAAEVSAEGLAPSPVLLDSRMQSMVIRFFAFGASGDAVVVYTLGGDTWAVSLE